MKRLWEYRYIFRYAFARILFLAHAFLVYQKVTGKRLIFQLEGFPRAGIKYIASQ